MKKTSTVTVIGAAALLLVGSGAGGAVAGSMITSAQIKNNTVRSIDVRDHTLGIRDFNWYTKRQIRQARRDARVAWNQAERANRRVGWLENRVKNLEDQPSPEVGFWGPFPKPRVVAPFLPVDGVTEFQLEAPGNPWNVQEAARLYDEQLSDIVIHTGGTCADNSKANCIKVVLEPEDPTGARFGWVSNVITVPDIKHTRTVHLNVKLSRTLKFNRHVSCHELGHALGLAHHHSDGCVTTKWPKEDHLAPSDLEIQALDKAY